MTANAAHVTQVSTMARKKPAQTAPGTEPEPEKPKKKYDNTAKVRTELLRQASFVVVYRQRAERSFTIQDYLDEILTPVVYRDYLEAIEGERRRAEESQV